MTKYRFHYSLNGIAARCGIDFPKNWTAWTTAITCGNCKWLLRKEVK